jgi:hypothetical protein
MNTLDWYYQEINTGYKSPFYELREAIAATPYQLVDTRFQVLDLINEGEFFEVFNKLRRH